MRSVPTPLRTLSQLLVIIAGVLLVFLIFLTVGDVVGRNLQDRSILGAVDISTLALVSVCLLYTSDAADDEVQV